MNSILKQIGLNPFDLANAALLPKIRRGRDFHCYDFSNKRYLDLYRADGASLLGYSVPGFQLAIKNRVSQALWQGLPHPIFKQVTRAITEALPNHVPLICPDRDALRSVLELFGCSVDRPLLPTQTDCQPSSNQTTFSWWLPFGPPPSNISVAVLPRPAFSGPQIVLISLDLFQKQLETQGSDLQSTLDFISFQTPVYAIQALLSGISALKSLGAFNQAARKDTTQQLGKWVETNWRTIALGKWRRAGPYLLHDYSASQYTQIFQNAYERGIILNPRSNGINFLPGIISSGEQKNLESCLSFQPNGEV